MSAPTKQALDESIQKHIADEHDGQFVTAYWLVVASQPVDGSGTRYSHYSSPSQTFHETDGLRAVGEKLVQDAWDEM